MNARLGGRTRPAVSARRLPLGQTGTTPVRPRSRRRLDRSRASFKHFESPRDLFAVNEGFHRAARSAGHGLEPVRRTPHRRRPPLKPHAVDHLVHRKLFIPLPPRPTLLAAVRDRSTSTSRFRHVFEIKTISSAMESPSSQATYRITRNGLLCKRQDTPHSQWR